MGAAIAALLASMLTFTGAAAAAAGPTAMPDADHTITTQGVGNARLGSTKAQLETQLGAGYTLVDAGQVLVDLFGYEVRKDGVLQFHALGFSNDPSLILFYFQDGAYQTAEGVGPGTTLVDAEGIYGDATLSFSFDNEGREFASFVSGPSNRISFQTNGGGADFAGVYAADATSTTDYVDGSTVLSVWVSCAVGVDCPALAVTGINDLPELTIIAMGLLVLGLSLAVLVRRHNKR